MWWLLLFSASPGNVTYVTADRAYWDLGSADGLQMGSAVTLSRRNRVVAQCQVDRLAAHHASCSVAGARAGDSVRADLVPPPQPSAPKPDRGPWAPPLPPLTAPVPFALVEDQPSPAATIFGASGRATLSHEAWFSVGDARPDFNRERLDLQGFVPLGFLNTSLALDLVAIGVSQRPVDARFRADQRAQLYVLQLALESRQEGRSWAASAGRIRPWAPGVMNLDGVELGWTPGNFELGVLAGALPAPFTLGVSAERWLANGYWGLEAGDQYHLFHRGRAGVVHSELGSTLEIEAEVGLSSKRWRSNLGGRYSDGFASARGHLDWRPLDTLELYLDGRYRRGRIDPFGPAYAIMGANHAQVGARWEFGPGWVSANGGWGQMRADDALRIWIGPEVGVPSFGPFPGTLSLGYQESLGWLPGRTIWLDSQLPLGSLQVNGRLSYLQDTIEGGALTELGVYGSLRWRLGQRFELQATLLGRVPLADVGGAFSPLGLAGRIGIAGVL